MRLIENELKTNIFAENWGLEEWLTEQSEEKNNASPDTSRDPKLTYQAGPLRESIIRELAFKSIAEYEVCKSLLLIANAAPCHSQFEYFITQIVDEGRHARLFREHLLRIGFSGADRIREDMAQAMSGKFDDVIEPFKHYFNKWVITNGDYIAGILIITVILEGVFAPTSELSEMKWKPFDHVAAHIQSKANTDELRHLAVCANIVKQSLDNDPSLKKRAFDCISEGLALWQNLPLLGIYGEIEGLYQMGLEQNKHLVSGYELMPGVLLSESTAESRMILSNTLVERIQLSRLKYIGLA